MPAPPQHDYPTLLADGLKPSLTARGISPHIADMAANFLRQHPDVLATIEAGRAYLVISPVSFVPRLLTDLEAQVAIVKVTEHVASIGVHPDGVLTVNLGLVLTQLRKSIIELN